MFKRVITWMQGRHTAFAVAELSIGTALAWFHRLDMNFVALCGTVQAMVLGHSIKEDYFESKKPADPVQNQDIPPGGQNS